MHQHQQRCLLSVSVIASLIGGARDVAVTTNAYNGDVIKGVSEEIEYALLDLFLCMCVVVCVLLSASVQKKCPPLVRCYTLCILTNLITALIHAQWYFHSPFRSWPTYEVAGISNQKKSAADIRHRTEFYVCHSFAFSMRCLTLGSCYMDYTSALNPSPDSTCVVAPSPPTLPDDPESTLDSASDSPSRQPLRDRMSDTERAASDVLVIKQHGKNACTTAFADADANMDAKRSDRRMCCS